MTLAPGVGSSRRSSALALGWLFGVVALLPVKHVHLPFNMELVDLWVVAAVPFLWISFVLLGRARISLAYGLPLLVIVVATCLSALHAPNPTRGMIVMVKELYLFLLFATTSIVMAGLRPDGVRRVTAVWATAAVAHAALILAQFLVPEVWHFTLGLAGQSRSFEHFRPSGLFISEKAGDANKAAFFQLLGFVPLILARLPRRTTMLGAGLLFTSILATGSMGTTLAFGVGAATSALALIAFDETRALFRKYVARAAVVAALMGASLGVALQQKPAYADHLGSIVTGRAEKSSGGRFALWERGIDAIAQEQVFFWGVGPENFREVDPSGNDNQLHNDALAFTVERGLLGLVGLMLLAATAVTRSVRLLRSVPSTGERPGAGVVVFVSAMAAVLMVSLTHQIFHARELWMVLSVQEAMVLHTRAST